MRLGPAIVLFVMSPAAAAAEERVACGDKPTDGCYATLADALAVAADGDVVVLPSGQYPGTFSLVGRDLSIRAASATDLPALVGDATDAPVFDVVGGALHLDALIIGNKFGRALEIASGATVHLEGARLTGAALQDEGGIVLIADSSLDVDRSFFAGGSATVGGGHIHATNSALSISDGRMVGGSAVFGGSIVSENTVAGSLELIGTSFVGNVSTSAAGGAVFVNGDSDLRVAVPVVIRRCRFEDNVSSSAGAVHAHYLGAPGLIEESVFTGNTTGAGGSAAVWHNVTDVVIRRSVFCANGPETSGGASGAVEVFAADSFALHNSQFVDNRHSAVRMASSVPATSIRHNHFVGNIAAFQPVLDAGFGVGVTFTDNLVAFNTGTSAVARQLAAEQGDQLVLDHNLWWRNAPEHRSLPDSADVYADPRLDRYQPGLPCQYLDETRANERDALWPSWYGAARDAGSERALDLDGSTADIGAFGGDLARAVPDWGDGDGDGVPVLFDCNRFDKTVASGLPNPPYNDIDEDCRGDDDFDADDDGFRPLDWALPGDPVDCDDADPRRFPGQREVPSNGVDDDCDGWADNTGTLAAGSCSAAPVSAGWLLVLGLLALRRRRSV